MTFPGNIVREEIGILVAISAEQFVFWVFKQQNGKFEIDLSMIKLEDDVNVGDWINVAFVMENGNADFHYVVRKTPADFNMPTLIVDERTIITTINFIPLDEFLYPLTAVEKNLRMCFSLEMGRIPLVFTNTYLPHCCYEGVAQITLNKNDVELKIENYYNTPWLVKKNVENYDFSSDQTLERKLPKGNGLIVRRANAKDFHVLSQEFGLILLNRQASEKFDLGDFIGFYVAEAIEDSLRRRFALAPRKLSFDLPVTKNSDGTIDITHEILVGGRPTINGCYYVEGVGDIRDSHALISTNIGDETRRLRVVSRCVFEPIGAYFTICELLSIPKNNDREKPIMGGNSICIDGLVLAKSDDCVTVYTNDRIVYKECIITFTTQHIDPLPEVGDLLEIIQHTIEPPRSRRYELDWVGKKQEQPYRTRMVDGILNVRVPISINDGHCRLYHNFFGVIVNNGNDIDFGSTRTTSGRKILHIWVKKVPGSFGINEWAVAEDPDPELELLPTPPIPPRIEPKEKKIAFRYVGSKYSSRSPIFAEAKSKKSPANTSASDSAQPTSTSSFTSPTSSRAKASGGRPPRLTKPQQLVETNENLELITRDHYNEYFPSRFGPMPETIWNSVKSRERTQRIDDVKAHFTPLRQTEQIAEQSSEFDEANFKARYKLDGVVASTSASGLFVYSSGNPDRECLLMHSIMDQPVGHGDWINYEANFHQKKYIVTAYVKRPPIFQTKPIRNSVELLITDAFMSTTNNGIKSRNPNEHYILTSKFLSLIVDSNNLLTEDMIGSFMDVWALRCRPNSESKTINWQLKQIVG